MSGDGSSQGDDFEEQARRHNSTLQSLIDTIGTVLAASRELLARLKGHPPQADAPGQGRRPAPTSRLNLQPTSLLTCTSRGWHRSSSGAGLQLLPRPAS